MITAIKNNARDVIAYALDVRCVFNNHNDYDYCYKVATIFSDERTLAKKVIQPMYKKFMKFVDVKTGRNNLEL